MRTRSPPGIWRLGKKSNSLIEQPDTDMTFISIGKRKLRTYLQDRPLEEQIFKTVLSRNKPSRPASRGTLVQVLVPPPYWMVILFGQTSIFCLSQSVIKLALFIPQVISNNSSYESLNPPVTSNNFVLRVTKSPSYQ